MIASFPTETVSKKHFVEKYDRVDVAKGIHRGSYNVNGYTTFQATKLLTSKQTNVYGLQETLPYFNGEQDLPRRIYNDGIFHMVECFVKI